MDHAEEDRRINEGKDVVVEKEWQQFWNSRSNSSNSSNRSTVNTMSVLIVRAVIIAGTKIACHARIMI